MLFRSSKAPDHAVPGWNKGRGYLLHLPRDYEDKLQPRPLVVALHGFTHDGKAMRALTSPNGDPSHPDSLDSLADREGFLVAYPNGTSLGIIPGRCWNGGGGVNGYAAVAKKAVDKKIDDLRYLQNLLDHIQSHYRVKEEEIFFTGISNGAALVHRFATEYPELVAGVAVVAGCNQFAVSSGVKPKAPVPVLHIHGTEDPIWSYRGGSVLLLGQMDSVDSSIAIWTQANAAQLVEEQTLQFPEAEDLPVKMQRYAAAASGGSPDPRREVVLYSVIGGGHAWPGGQQYLSEKIIGRSHPRFSANSTIWDFFKKRLRHE